MSAELRAMKICLKCGVEKPLTEFNRASKARDGLRTRCRDCCRAYGAVWRAAHPEVKARWVAANREKFVVYAMRQVRRDPEKRAARMQVFYAIARGEMARPLSCPVCGATRRIHAHHDDYAKPLDVRWLCPKCHQAEHVRLRQEARGAA